MAHFAHYRRVIVTMREGTAPVPALRLAAELAHLLDLELEGVFIENEALLHLASLPFAREIRLPGHTWQSLDAKRLMADFDLAAGRAERLLAAAARARGVASTFSILRGDPVAASALGSHPDDILVMAEPEAERPDWPLGRGVEARKIDAGVLLAPAKSATRHGPIAAAGRPGLGLALAEAIALRAGEDLLLLTPEGSSRPPLPLGPRFSAVGVLRRIVPSLAPALLARAASRSRARLLVLDRIEEQTPDEQRFLIRFVEQTGMPVLLTHEPEEPSPSASARGGRYAFRSAPARGPQSSSPLSLWERGQG
ncbi:MAG: hypothetical protein ACREFZ_03860 [Acetobacteraceae bacterium]